jgi:hemolysin activation/secretion protein
LTNYNFERNPFSSQHTIAASYFFATQGLVLNYKGELANVFGTTNLVINAHYNSPNFAVNYFGYGNSTANPEVDNDNIDFDFNRVKIRTISASPSLIWRGQYGSTFEAGIAYESNEIERTPGRYLETEFPANDELFDQQAFFGAQAKYTYDVKDDKTFPTLGMMFSVEAGYRNNTNTTKGFGYVIPELAFDYKLVPEGQVVLATKLRGHINLGDDFEFYQAAVLGDQTGLRGYRKERFSGKSAFVQSTDLRFNLRRKSSNFLPFNVGFFGGFDFGRVWIDDSRVADPSFNEDQWNTSIGGGIFVTAYSMINANLSAFNSDDGLRIAFKLGFGF